MKALFYTATAVFISLAAVIAYFALQPPTSMTGARVVLDIDAGAIPTPESSSQANPGLDPYAGEEDRPVSDAADSTVTPQDQQPEPIDQQAHAAVAADAPLAAEPVGSHHAGHDGASEPAEVPTPPPGTALAGLEQGGPLFREIKPEAEQTQTSAATQVDEPQAEPQRQADEAQVASAASGNDEPMPGAHLSMPEPREQEQDRLPPSALAEPAPVPPPPAPARHAAPEVAELPPAELPQPPEQRAAAAPPPPSPPPPSPPIPVRRPNVPVEDRAATTANASSWSGAQYAAVDAVQNSNKPPARIGILLRGVGRNDQDAADAIGSLPSAISLGFWPYASQGKVLAARAREKGHEVIVQLPLEPNDSSTSNAGPDALLTSAPPEENAQRLQSVLKRFEGASGVTNLMGGKMLHAKTPLKPVLQDLKARGMLYVGESGNSHGTVKELAKELNLRYGAADVMIDAQPSPEAIDKALARLVSIARQRGSAIGIGNANALTVQQVHEWSDSLAAQGISLVPIGALAQTPGSS